MPITARTMSVVRDGGKKIVKMEAKTITKMREGSNSADYLDVLRAISPAKRKGPSPEKSY